MLEKITMIEVDRLVPHPKNPRLGMNEENLDELAESIKAKGVLQNLTVVPRGDGSYTIIIGHRRHAAAIKAGIAEVPCVIADMTEKEQIETMLLENISRDGLTPYEQAQGFQMMMDLGSTVGEIAASTGFSTKTVRHRLEMAKLDADTLKESGNQLTITELIALEAIDSIEERNRILKTHGGTGTANFNNQIRYAKEAEERNQQLKYLEKALYDAGISLSDKYRWSSDIEIIDSIQIENAYDPDELEKIKNPDIDGYLKTYYSVDLIRNVDEETMSPEKKAAIEKEKYRIERRDNARRVLKEINRKRSDWLIANAKKSESDETELLRDLIKEMSGSYKMTQACINIYGRDIDRYDQLDWMDIESYLKVVGITSMYGTDMLDYGGKPDKWAIRRESDILNFMKELGYEPSEEELSVIDGTHEIYSEEFVADDNAE